MIKKNSNQSSKLSNLRSRWWDCVSSMQVQLCNKKIIVAPANPGHRRALKQISWDGFKTIVWTSILTGLHYPGVAIAASNPSWIRPYFNSKRHHCVSSNNKILPAKIIAFNSCKKRRQKLSVNLWPYQHVNLLRINRNNLLLQHHVHQEGTK